MRCSRMYKGRAGIDFSVEISRSSVFPVSVVFNAGSSDSDRKKRALAVADVTAGIPDLWNSTARVAKVPTDNTILGLSECRDSELHRSA